MLYKGSKIYLNDNCGVLKAKIINIFLKKKKIGIIGNIVNIIAYSIKKQKKIIKKKLYFGLIVFTALWTKRLNGFFIRYDNNKLIIINHNFTLIGTRLYHRIGSFELKNFFFGKLNKQLKFEKILVFLKYIF